LEGFIDEFFDQNPISQIGIIITKNKRAEKISDLAGNPRKHIKVRVMCVLMHVSMYTTMAVANFCCISVLYSMITSINGDIPAISETEASKVHTI
jgi:hypothetical protein